MRGLTSSLLSDALAAMAPRGGKKTYEHAVAGSRAKNRPGRVRYVNHRGELEYDPYLHGGRER